MGRFRPAVAGARARARVVNRSDEERLDEDLAAVGPVGVPSATDRGHWATTESRRMVATSSSMPRRFRDRADAPLPPRRRRAGRLGGRRRPRCAVRVRAARAVLGPLPPPARGSNTEMCGGGSLGWEPGEFTDDTQMALLVASSLVERGGLDEADLFDRFRTWAAADPPDVGNQTRAVLGSGRPWDVAAAEHFARSGHAAGNGSLMRTTPAAICFSRFGTDGDHGRRPADLGADPRRPVRRRGLRDLPRADAGGPGRRGPAGRDPLGAGAWSPTSTGTGGRPCWRRTGRRRTRRSRTARCGRRSGRRCGRCGTAATSPR